MRPSWAQPCVVNTLSSARKQAWGAGGAVGRGVRSCCPQARRQRSQRPGEPGWLWKQCRSVVSDSLRPHGLEPARLLCPKDSPGKDTGVGCCSLLHGIVPNQGWNPSLLHRRQVVYCLSRRGALRVGGLGA